MNDIELTTVPVAASAFFGATWSAEGTRSRAASAA
jgi:hypothetical protein